MKIAVDINCLARFDGRPQTLTGIGYYVDGLLTGLGRIHPEAQEILPFLPLGSMEALRATADASEALAWWSGERVGRPSGRSRDTGHFPVLLPARRSENLLKTAYSGSGERWLARVVSNRAAYLQVRWACAACDVLHLTGYSYLPATWYKPRRAAVVTLYDVTTRTHAWAHSEEVIRGWETVFAFAKERAARIIAISEATKQEAVRVLGITEERIDVTPLAPRPATRHVPPGPERDAAMRGLDLRDRPFVLYAGTLEPRKNVERLLQAFARLTQEEPGQFKEHVLVLAGGAWPGQVERLHQVSEELGITERVTMTGYVSGDTMNALMSACEAFAYISLQEGFGLPPLEAMVCGAPVVTSRVSSLPEVAGEAGIQVDPESVEEIAGALHRLLTDSAENARRRALSKERAAQFSWERTAALTLKSYEAAVAG